MFQEYCKKIKYVEWKNIFKLIVGLIFKREVIVDGLNCVKNEIQNINQIEMPLLISMVDLQKGTVYIASSKETKNKHYMKM